MSKELILFLNSGTFYPLIHGEKLWNKCFDMRGNVERVFIGRVKKVYIPDLKVEVELWNPNLEKLYRSPENNLKQK